MSMMLPSVNSSEIKRYFPIDYLSQIRSEANTTVTNLSFKEQLNAFCDGLKALYEQFDGTQVQDALESIDNEQVSLFQSYLSSFAGAMGDLRLDKVGDFSASLGEILRNQDKDDLRWLEILDYWLNQGLEKEIKNWPEYDVGFDNAIASISPKRIRHFFDKVREWRPYMKYGDHDWPGFVGCCGYFFIICRFRTWPNMLHPRDMPIVIEPGPTGHADTNAPLRFALMGDWGSGRYGAIPVAKSIEDISVSGNIFAIVHLGDIYYSGTLNEVEENFLTPFPSKNFSYRRALNGNHEMYSGGNGYFHGVLPEFDQDASYFAFSNDDWIMAGLDTCYESAHLTSELNEAETILPWVRNESGGIDVTQVKWLHGLAEGNKKSIVLFTHHNPYSVLAGPYPEGSPVLEALAQLFLKWKDEERKVVWYWGHEHACIWYDRDDKYGFWGRCVGHGGFAYKRYPKDFIPHITPNQGALNNSNWQRLPKIDDIPSGDYLVDENTDRALAGKDYGANGYVTIEFKSNSLFEEVRQSDGAIIYSNQL